ncbi:MAG TPA: Ig-like domain-containing protein, partial [Gemmatimonadaceae bacterium]|nr:Ig-like domain-containing protein [Gemmatimonadaceae bacterium]
MSGSASRARRLVALGTAVGAVACASQGIPPGGPPDLVPPVLLHVSPESGTVNVTPRAVAFVFDEVVSERPRGAQSLDGLVVISPSDGKPDVSWDRTRIVIRPRHGWHANTAYAVTILPGLADLRGNATKRALRTVFATGATIPTGVVAGAAFDWMAGKFAPMARVEATIGADTLLRYAIAADSLGRFSLGSLPAATFLVRAWMDLNNNGVRDVREPWDTVTLAVHDSARHDFYMFAHDTLGAHLATVALADSTAIRIKFDHGLRPTARLAVDQVSVTVAKDSSVIPVLRILTLAAYDSIAAINRAFAEDSILRADTTARGRQALATRDSLRLARARDSSAKLQIDSLRLLRDTVKREPPPVPARAVPATEFVVITAA